MNHDHGKGDIKDNHAAALVRSKMFRQKVEPDKKTGYTRKTKHKGNNHDLS